ncbi:MAG: TrlF family AAA-like ATPase [Pseudomonadota bacterium]
MKEAKAMTREIVEEYPERYWGARFFKCALQVNPHDYAARFRGKEHGVDEDAYIQAMVAKAAELNIEVLAITHHNHVGAIGKFRNAAKSRSITIIPGFEITSSDGVHVLCLYEPEIAVDRLDRYLGAFDIHDTDPNAKLANTDFCGVLEKVNEQGGIGVAAHVTLDNGLLRVLTGQSRVRAWKDSNLLAIQIPGPVNDLPQEYRFIVENKNADYRREPQAGDKLAVAAVNAADVKEPDDLAQAGATCWIKMTRPSVESLRLAFLDPDSRIHLNSDVPPEEHSRLIGLSWEGGFLDGNEIYFSDNLNVLVGGRGAGKSTVIESLRAVLQTEPLGDEARKRHAGIAQDVLKNGTRIRLTVRSRHPQPQTYAIERTLPNPAVIKGEDGRIVNLRPSDLLPQLEIYGQHEIAELARLPEKRHSLLKRFLPHERTAEQDKANILRSLEKNRSAIVALHNELRDLEEKLARFPAIEEQLRRFADAGVEDKLKTQSLFIKEERILDTCAERLQGLQDALEVLREHAEMDLAFLAEGALDGLPSADRFRRIRLGLEGLSLNTRRLTDLFERRLGRTREALSAERAGWDSECTQAREEYEKTLRALQRDRIDGTEFIALRKQLETLRPLAEERIHLQRRLEGEEERRRELLDQWEEVLRREFQALSQAAKGIGRKLRDRLRVGTHFGANRKPLETFLRDHVGGRIGEAIERLKTQSDLSIRVLAQACRQGAAVLVRQFGLPPAQAERLAAAGLDVSLRLEELELPPEVALEMNVAAPGQPVDWKPLDKLSTGQKATAVLMLLFLESEAPLVIDQPEDDLDNRFITENIVPELRREKRQRQFIFATHNANIPVLGDAELIVGITPHGEAGVGQAVIEPEHIGSVDSSTVRLLVEDILEGGKEAFERRRAKYGF